MLQCIKKKKKKRKEEIDTSRGYYPRQMDTTVEDHAHNRVVYSGYIIAVFVGIPAPKQPELENQKGRRRRLPEVSSKLPFPSTTTVSSKQLTSPTPCLQRLALRAAKYANRTLLAWSAAVGRSNAMDDDPDVSTVRGQGRRAIIETSQSLLPVWPTICIYTRLACENLKVKLKN